MKRLLCGLVLATIGISAQTVDSLQRTLGTYNYPFTLPGGAATGDYLCAEASDSIGGVTCQTDYDAAGSNYYSFKNYATVPANLMKAGSVLRVPVIFQVWSPAASVPFNISASWGATAGQTLPGGTVLYSSVQSTTSTGLAGTSFKGELLVTTTGAPGGSVESVSAMSVEAPIWTTASWKAGQTTTNIATNAQKTIVISARWQAMGVAAAVYVSGGSFNGTGSCALGTFNDSSTAIGSIAVASNVPGAITITSRGVGATAAPTTAVVTSGTATCFGTIMITSTLGGSAGNALRLVSVGPVIVLQ
jgi:hypothetical protein